MTTANKRFKLRTRSNLTDFSKVGGLSNHIKLLREIIIFPLLYGDLYKHFNVKAPRGVLFYGPPGTGKTLVAGALATELSREGNGKVTFYQRKGADILDKWVGESERKLTELFHQAMRSRPSVIFFDELDGLAPVRSQKNDQVHCSVVATLLALMDGLDNMPGVIVIGATNRIDSIDPALRRPGRFDKELYFPLPSASARKEILQVHTDTWQNKPSNNFLHKMSELTSGCCGSDLQALCAEAVLCSLKREYPDVHKPSLIGTRIKVEIENIVVKEVDFLNARMNLVTTSQRLGNYRVRKLSPFIKPLLQRQLDKITRYINILLPQFTHPFKKFLIGNERYAGRLVLKGTNQQGLTVHIIPAILQALEHIPCYMLDIPALFETNIRNARQNLPSILVLSRVDDWWDMIEPSTQLVLTAMLEDLHAGIPLFLIATCTQDLPNALQNYFYSNSSIVIKMDDPNTEEREHFFAPLFFGNADSSVAKILKKEDQDTVMKQFVTDDVDDGRKMSSIKRCKRTVCLRKRQTLKAHPQASIKTHPQSSNDSEVSSKRKADTSLPSTVTSKKPKISASLHRKMDKGWERLRGGGKEKEEMDIRPYKLNHCKLRKLHSLESSTENSDASTVEPTSSIDSLARTQFFPNDDDNVLRRTTSTPTLVDIINCSRIPDRMESDSFRINATMSDSSLTSLYDAIVKQEAKSETSLHAYNPFESTSKLCYDTSDPDMEDIYNLWKRTAHITSADLPVGQLELLYDIISACIVINKCRSQSLIQELEKTLTNFENSSMKNCIQHLRYSPNYPK